MTTRWPAGQSRTPSLAKRAGDPRLASAVGSTMAANPGLKGPLARVRAGALSAADFMALYGGQMRGAFLGAKAKHGPRHGFSNKSVADYGKSLTEP